MPDLLSRLRRRAGIYGAFAAIVPKLFTAHWLWAWVELFAQLLMMTVLVFFWRAVYANTDSIGGLSAEQTINYILLAQLLAPLIQSRFIFSMGFMLREGLVAIELLRPVDFQGRYYVENIAEMATSLVLKLPLLLFAWLAFGLTLPSDPLVWAAFLLSVLLGRSILFLFSWLFACLAFYSTETWGLSVVYEGLSLFFSGVLLPLTIMPSWLLALAAALPFAQALYVPVSFLSGITPVAEAPRTWLVQLLWLAGLLVLSRLVFALAVRKVTVQGG